MMHDPVFCWRFLLIHLFASGIHCPVPNRPHKLGLWVWHISSQPSRNAHCPAGAILEAIHHRAIPDCDIKIGTSTYSIPASCSRFTKFEVAATAPGLIRQWNATEELSQFVEKMDGDTHAIVMIGKWIDN